MRLATAFLAFVCLVCLGATYTNPQTTRIINLPEVTAPLSTDVLLMDRDGLGARKVKLENLASNIVSVSGSTLTKTNAAELSSYDGGFEGLVVSTLGYYSANDGGGFQYVFRASSTATNLPNLQGVGGAWEIVNWKGDIRAFGAKADGVTDDSVAWQSAANYRSNIVLPKNGRFFIGTASANPTWDNGGATNEVGVILQSGTTIEGNGSVLVFTNGSATFANQFACLSWDRSADSVSNITIRDLEFQYDGPAGYYGSGILFEPPDTATNGWAKKIRIQNITAARVRGGIIIRATGLNTNYPIQSVQISDVLIEGTTSTGVTLCGIDGGSLSRLTVQGSEFDGLNIFGVRNFTFSDCTGNDIAEGFPLMSGGTIRRNEYLTFNNLVNNGRGIASKCDFTSGNNSGADGTLAYVVVNNLIANNATVNIQGDYWPAHTITFNNPQVFGGVGSAKRGMYANRVTNLVIGNPVINTKGGAIVLQSSTRVSVNNGHLSTTAEVSTSYGTNVMTLDGAKDVRVTGTSFSGGTNGLFIVGASGSPLGVTVGDCTFENHSASPIANDGTVTTSFRLRLDNCNFNGTNLTAVTNTYAINRNSYIPLAPGLGPLIDLSATTTAAITHEFHDIGGSSSNTLLNISGGQLGQRVTFIGVNSQPTYITGSASGNIRNAQLGGAVLSGNRSIITYRYDGTTWLCEADSSYKGVTAGSGSEVTVTNKAIIASSGYHRLSSSTNQELNHIVFGSTFGQYDLGKLLTLQLATTAQPVTIKHAQTNEFYVVTGNLRTSSGSDIEMTNVNKAISFVWDGARWMQVD